MFVFLSRLLDPSGFVPRRLCGEWTTGLIGLHNVSDTAIWLAYLAIPLALLVIIRRRNDVPFRNVFVLFLAFIVTCGFTHFLDVVMFYEPLYRLSGLLKAVTAVVSWATVVALIPIIPKVLALRSPEALHQEIVERERAESQLRLLQTQLEERVAQRTAELEGALAALRAENAERTRVERQLWESREELRLVTDNAPLMLVHCDTERRYKFVNRSYAATFGLKPQDLIGKRICDIVGDQSYERIRENIDLALAGTRVDREVEGPYQGTEQQWLRFTCLPSYSSAGEVQGALAVIVDVTERRSAEHLLQTIIDTVPALIAYVDTEGRYRLNNRAYEDSFGRSRSDIAGRSARELVAEAAWAIAEPRLAAALAGETVRFEAQTPNTAGEAQWFDVTYTPHCDAAGAVLGVVVMGNNITTKKLIEIALSESEVRFRNLADAMPQIVWTASPNGNFDYCNERWYDYTGFRKDIVDPNRWTTLVHPDEVAACGAAWNASLRSGEPYEVEYRFRNGKTGAYRWHLARAVAVRDEDGGIVRWLGTGTDIDDQKRAEQSLQDLNSTLERQVAERTLAAESEQRLLDAILDALPVAVVIADPSGRLTRFNHACEQVWGIPPHSQSIDEYQEWVGYWPATGQLIAPQEWAMSRALLEGEVCRGELLEFVRFGDRSRRMIHNSAAPVWGPGGTLLGAVVASMDVTDQMAAQAALAESEERFRSAFDSAPIGMALVAPDQRTLLVNRSLCHLVGYTEQELLAATLEHIAHPEDRDAGLDAARQLLAGTMAEYQIEQRYIHHRGHVVHVVVSVSLVRNPAGSPLYFVNQIKDVTQRHQDEKALAATDALLRQFIKHSPAAIAMFDTDLRYLQMSDRWLIDYHLTGREIVGLSHYQVFPDISETWKAVHQRVLAGAIEKCDEDPFPRADGSTEWLQWECRPWLNAGGEIGGLVMYTQVITERKTIEENVKASLREKEVLLKEIHHRVKNNLQIVSTLLDLQSGYTTDQATREMFRETRGRVKSMALIHERLYRSQDMSRVDFAQYTRQLVDDLYRTYKISEDDIRLDLDIDIPELSIDIAIPCGLLLNELISNCFKHAFVGGAAGCLQVALHREPGGVNVLIVADDGVGFPPGTDFRDTTSFGLQLVNTLVEQLAGEITLAVDHGATFTVRFPRPPAAH